MAARLLLQRRAMAPLTATLLAGGIAFYPAVSHAEAPSSLPSKKPIYDDYDSPPTAATLPSLPPSRPEPSAATPSTTSAITSMITGSSPEPARQPARSPTPTDRLAHKIGHARLWLYHRVSTAEEKLNAGLSRLFETEASITSTLASLAPPPESGERLMPGVVYVLVSSMAGSIIARNKNVLVRVAAPVGFGLGAAYVLLPVTMGNVGRLVWEYEKRFPKVAETHLKVREKYETAVRMARVHARLAVEEVENKVREARESVEGWVKKGK